MSTKAVIAGMDDLLRARGFTRQKATWNRTSGSFIDVIDVQTSKAGDAITINAGVMSPEVHRKFWGKEPPAFIDEPSCTVRARIGQLVDGHDIWWRLNDLIFDDVAEKLTAHVLPFLERMHSLEAMERFLTAAEVTKQKYPPPIICLAILKSEQGDRAGAWALLTDFRTKTVPAWKTRITEVAERLGCP